MRRLFYKGLLQDTITITGEDAAHLMYAMRAKKGERLTVADDANNAATMEAVAFSPDTVTLKLIERLPLLPPPTYSLTLAQCLLKGDKTELVWQKGTELGASKFVPLVSRNTVVRLVDENKAAAKVKRWQKIAAEAAKQCGGLVPEIAPITPLADFLPNLPDCAALIFCHENETQTTLRQTLRELTDTPEIILLIGAEGGFTLDEAERIKAVGGRAVTLGRRILRAETAAIVALAAVQYEKGEL